MNYFDIINKWYKTLEFKSDYDKAFENIKEKYKDFDFEGHTYDYLDQTGDPELNLLYFLYKCEDVANQYKEKGLPENVLVDTLKDIVIWTDVYFGYSGGKLGLEEIGWLRCHHMKLNLFRLGRLEFDFDKNVKLAGMEGTHNLLQVHIPNGGGMTPEACDNSFKLAEEFFPKYFPEFEFEYYACDSWLLDESMKEIAGESSNIYKFNQRFKFVHKKPEMSGLKYVFDWKTTPENLAEKEAVTSVQKKMKDFVTSGGQLYEVLGIFSKKELYK